MAEGLNVNANLNSSSFNRGLTNMEHRVSRFARMAPRMAVAGAIGAGISAIGGAGAGAFGLGRIQEQAAFAHGVVGTGGPEAKVYGDIEEAYSIPGALSSLINSIEADLDQMREGAAPVSVHEKYGRAGIDYHEGLTAEDAMRQLLDRVGVAGPEGELTWDQQQLANRFPGLKQMMSAGVTQDLIDNLMESKLAQEDFQKLYDAAVKIEKAVDEWNDFFDRRKADVVGLTETEGDWSRIRDPQVLEDIRNKIDQQTQIQERSTKANEETSRALQEMLNYQRD